MKRTKTKLTEKALRALRPGQWAADADAPGLVARKHARAVTFAFRYMWAGKRRIMPIGEWQTFQALLRTPADGIAARPKYDASETVERVARGASHDDLIEVVLEGATPLLTLEEARNVAREFRRRLKAGENPAEHAKADWRMLTLQEALDLYLDSGKARSPRTVQGYRDTLDRYLKDWLPRTLVSFTPREIHDRHRKIGANAGQYAANGAMRVLRAIYNRARQLYLELPPNPCDAVDWYAEKRREAAIPRDLLPQWYKEVQALSNGVRRDLYLLMLFTGLRRETAVSVRLTDLNLDAMTLHVPKPKGGEARAFTIPLTEYIVGILRRRIAENAKQLNERNAKRASKGLPELAPSPWLFPAFSKSGHVTEPKAGDKDNFTVPFTPHGLRHTYISAATAAGVHPYSLKLLTNHTLPKGDVTAGYVLPDIEALRVEQEKVTAYLQGQLTPALTDTNRQKVVSLKRRAAH